MRCDGGPRPPGRGAAGPRARPRSVAARRRGRAAATTPGPNRTTESPRHWNLSAPSPDLTVSSMSTLARTAPSRETGGGTASGRIISRPLLVVFLFEFCSLTSFDLLLSVTPMYAAAGAGSAGAGLVTGMLLLGTVAAEL